MFKITTFKHSEITKELFDDIIGIKSVAWPYSYEQQMQWIKHHLKPNDIHVILSYDSKHVAYLNLVDIEFTINGIQSQGYGIGNVCSIRSGLGYGRELMLKTNEFLHSVNKQGLLLCRVNLVPFYKKVDWHLLNKNAISLSFDHTEIDIMIYNTDVPVTSLKYFGQPF